ncbi:unnamed protein product [Chilo suppressalis]|uniref:Uncharacterized protein n=1 Tax=Chilo suppressalis TaxID=168631 RepID=A0ABN8AVK8_CHISP|nr:unnamed protein product [Chilo suppressalis]
MLSSYSGAGVSPIVTSSAAMPACALEYSRLARSNTDPPALLFLDLLVDTRGTRRFARETSAAPEDYTHPHLGTTTLLPAAVCAAQFHSSPSVETNFSGPPDAVDRRISLYFLEMHPMVGYALSSKNPNKPRTVLISGGSSVQALHLARNFHSAGARVVAFEIEGQFSLLKYSAAVNKFFTVPRPNPADPLAYARALREIVDRESVVFYVPVSSTTPAYYDALAKPLLEVVGCQCFVPCARDVVTLDDPLELIRVCRAAGLATPQFWVVTSEDDVRVWYESGAAKEGRHFIASAGARGARDRLRFVMPNEKGHFRFPREISVEKPWVIVREPKGERIVTCTTLRESQAANNVTCRVDSVRKGLVPQKDDEADAWVQRFVSHLAPARPMTGHVSFRLVREEGTTNGHNNRLFLCRTYVKVPRGAATPRLWAKYWTLFWTREKLCSRFGILCLIVLIITVQDPTERLFIKTLKYLNRARCHIFVSRSASLVLFSSENGS